LYVQLLKGLNICTGIKVDKGLVPLANSNGESWCQGLDGLAERTAEYYKAGARFAKWRAVVSIPAGPTQAALRDAAYGLARYAAISQVCSSNFTLHYSDQISAAVSLEQMLSVFAKYI